MTELPVIIKQGGYKIFNIRCHIAGSTPDLSQVGRWGHGGGVWQAGHLGAMTQNLVLFANLFKDPPRLMELVKYVPSLSACIKTFLTFKSDTVL